MASQDPIDSLPITRRKREAEEWALVLTAEGIDSEVTRTEAGFTITVAPSDQARCEDILRAWLAERAERSERLARVPPPQQDTTPLETAMAYLLALGLLAFHLGLKASGRWTDLRQIGRSQAAVVLEGEWWRLVTALTLHADLPHALGNTLFGGFFLAALSGRLGTGVALLCFFVTGTLGNLANALYYGSGHSSIGASTGVFGLVGVLAGLAAWRRHRSAPPRRGAWVAFAAGLGIVAMLGSGGPGIDFSAHLFGLAAGGLTGMALAVPLAVRDRPGRVGQISAGAAALAIPVLAWSLAQPWNVEIAP